MLKILHILLVQCLLTILFSDTQLNIEFNKFSDKTNIVVEFNNHSLSDQLPSVFPDIDDDQNSLKELDDELNQYYFPSKIKLYHSENTYSSFLFNTIGLLQLDIPPPFAG